MSTPIALTGGDESLKVSLAAYQAAWKAFIVINHLEAFEHTLEPMAISWKVEHKVSLFANLRMLGDRAVQTHIANIRDRFIALAFLGEPFIGFKIIKILERRPGAHDPLGLDSIDYQVENISRTYDILKATGAKVVKDSNEVHEWLSLRFGKNHEFEAKFLDHSLVGVAVKELAELEAAADDLT